MTPVEQARKFLDDHMARDGRLIVILSTNCDGSGQTGFSLLSTGSVADAGPVYNEMSFALSSAFDAAIVRNEAVGDA